MSLILVADDEPHIVRLVEFALGNHGFDVVTATNGEEAVRLAAERMPDLVLMDVMMPVMNGFEAVRRIKGDPATADIPILMLSAKSQRTEVTEGLDAGAEAYICKPFSPRELVERVGATIGSAEGSSK
jgi:DNA-binding response OmpR family regulator